MSIEDAKQKVIERGGVVRDSLTKDIWYLVTNTPEEDSDIIRKAKELHMTIIDEEEFLKMLE